MSKADYEHLIQKLRRKGINDERVLNAILSTPRELFMTKGTHKYATEDSALPIECEQTISQPYIVARMTAAILNNALPPKKVLEIGTGSGYQAAILAKLVSEIHTVERIEFLYHQVKQRLHNLAITNVHCHYGDGYEGWSEHAPYDAILVTAASPNIPDPLLEQLVIGGYLVIPVGTLSRQSLLLITRTNEGYEKLILDPVVFVPLLPGTEES